MSQLYLGLGDRVSELLRAIELVPDRVLSLDTLVEANFEWLQKLNCDRDTVETWFRRHVKLVKAVPRIQVFQQHLHARQAPPGTEPIGSLPMATLACAYHVTSRSEHRADAEAALLGACEFAPRLVIRDLVLSRALLADSYTPSNENAKGTTRDDNA